MYRYMKWYVLAAIFWVITDVLANTGIRALELLSIPTVLMGFGFLAYAVLRTWVFK